MNIIVTGSAGFLAKAFISEYQSKYSIKQLVLPQERSDEAHIATDYSVEHLCDLLEGCEGVVHLAAQKVTTENESRGLSAYFPSLLTLENLLKASKISGVKNIVFTSSRCVYGTYTDTAFSENDLCRPINYYGISKEASEQLCSYYNREYGLKVKMLRVGQVVGTSIDEKTVFPTFIRNALQNREIILIKNDKRDYIYVKDVIKALDAAISARDASGIFNISIGEAYENCLIAQTIVDMLKSKSNTIVDYASNATGDRIVMDRSRAESILSFKCQFSDIESIVEDIVMENGGLK